MKSYYLTMWLIGIRSGIITILLLIAYGMIVQMMQLKSSIWGNLEHVVFAIGIYSGHYYYKYAHKGYMTYREGVQVGLIVAGFTALVSGAFTYGVAKFVDPFFTKKMVASIKVALQQNQLEEGKVQEIVHFIEANMTPGVLLVIIPLATLLVGFIFNLIIAIFSRHAKQ